MKDIFGLDPEQLFILSYNNQYLFTFYIIVQKFMADIFMGGNINDDESGIFPKQKNRNLYNTNIRRHIKIYVMLFPHHI